MRTAAGPSAVLVADGVGFALFQPRQVQQVVNHHQQPLGIVAGIHEQFELLRAKRPQRLFQQKVQRKPDARQRRFQLVADRRHQIALHLVEQPKAGNVLQQHRRPDCYALGIADGQDPRQERMSFLSHRQHDGLVEAFGQVLLLVLQNVGQRLSQWFWRLPYQRRLLLRLLRHDPKQATASGIGQLDVLLRVHHQHGIGKGVDRGLAGLLCADQLRLVRLAVIAKLAGHGIEGAGQLPQFILGGDGHELIQIARSDRRGRFGHGADRLQDRADRAGHEEHGQGNADGQAAAIPDQRGAGHAARLPVGLFHVVLVDPQNLAGDGLDLAEGAIKPRLVLVAEVEIVPLLAGVLEKIVSLPAITVAQCCQLVDQFAFAWQSDVVLLLEQAGFVELPVRLILLVRFLFPSGQCELERRVDAFQGLVEIAHVDHAVVVLAQNLVDAVAEAVNQNGPVPPSATSRANSGSIAMMIRRRKVMEGIPPIVQMPYFFRFRYSVLGSMPSFVAASSIVAVEAKVRRICSASI